MQNTRRYLPFYRVPRAGHAGTELTLGRDLVFASSDHDHGLPILLTCGPVL